MANGSEKSGGFNVERVAQLVVLVLVGLGFGTQEYRQSNRAEDQATRLDAFESSRAELLQQYNRRFQRAENALIELRGRLDSIDRRIGTLERTDAEHIAQRDVQIAQIRHEIELASDEFDDLGQELGTVARQLALLQGRFVEQPARRDHTHREILEILRVLPMETLRQVPPVRLRALPDVNTEPW